MKIKLTYEEACSVLQKYYYDALVEDVPDDDIEIEIEQEAMEDLPDDILQLAQNWESTEIPWQPDGRTPPPSADAFMAWAKGKKVCFPWDPTIPLTVDSVDDKWAHVLCPSGNKDRWVWQRIDWQEYIDAN